MKKLVYFLAGLLIIGCKEVYLPPVKPLATGYLVIEGSINSGSGNTHLTLSRTSRLDSIALLYETGANVILEGENNSSFSLTETTPGQYTVDNLNLNPAIKYRLRINTNSGKEYQSDFAAVNNNPPIDSISYKRENGDGVQLYINAHDPQNNTRYYQWRYDETWQIESTYLSYLKYKITPHSPFDIYSVVYKDSVNFSYDSKIYDCWQYNSSKTLLLGSTAKLSQDIVYMPLTFIPHASVKISILYSIIVKQDSWTKEGYEFLGNMKKNTESTGSIFDAQPSELKGNFHCTSDSTEQVIGYFNICPEQEKRIFIASTDLPMWNYQSNCYAIEIFNTSDDIINKGVTLMPAFVSKMGPFGSIATFYAAPHECVDCTLRGSNIKPAYWP